MKPLICELCSSNDFIKQDGLFRCQSCNTAYTLEEARKIMSVSIDRTGETSNLLVRAQRFLDDNNFVRAREYCEKVLDIDANNQGAMLLRKKWIIKMLSKRFKN
ncbi:MAG: TFIIB-type zinc finger domain-containing protein [Defluviitaleaceae bacterium]|nr:TFIIB-type zinc finger domain-containing protein [Defluviitaleaceae bacterium]